MTIRRSSNFVFAVCTGLLFSALNCNRTSADEPDVAALEFFEAKVRPLLVTHCYQCHSEEAEKAQNLEGGLRLDIREGIRTGGQSGPAIVPGKPNESLLIQSVRYTNKALQMPPDNPLSADQVAVLETWITMGAPDPRDGDHDGSDEAGIDIDAARQLWAFQVPVRHVPPQVSKPDWPRQQLDHFILAALEQRGLQPVRAATRQELIRRATFDLIGLPPTPEEVVAFENDMEPGAWDRVIDRLLASPHYGERWGRYWLDVARYADDQGNSFLTPTPAAYLYRDWVVKALNDDMPYHEFLRLQIAGDEVPGRLTTMSGGWPDLAFSLLVRSFVKVLPVKPRPRLMSWKIESTHCPAGFLVSPCPVPGATITSSIRFQHETTIHWRPLTMELTGRHACWLLLKRLKHTGNGQLRWNSKLRP